MENILKTVFENANRPSDFSNRSYYVKSLNKLLNAGIIKIELCERNKVWNDREDGFRYNLSIKFPIPNTTKRYKLDFRYGTIIEPIDVLDAVAKCIKKDHIQSHIKEYFTLNVSATESTGHVCGKCHGNKIIPAFKHVCSGICFDCGGSGLPFKGEYKAAKLNVHN